MRPPRALAAALGLAPALALGLAAQPAHADPQTTVGLTIGAAGVGEDRALWDTTVFHLGLRGDLLLGRSDRDDFGLGPYAELLTHAFDEIQAGGGLSLFVPVPEFPVVVSAGGYGRSGADPHGLEPGLAAQLFWGTRSYNYHAAYGLTAGLVGQFRYGLGDLRETAFVVAAQLDLQVLALPFVLLAGALRGGSPDTDRVQPELTSRLRRF